MEAINMAQLNITLNQEEIMRLLIADRKDAFRMLFQDALNAFIKAESDNQIGAAAYERSNSRTDSRNGVRKRTLTTRIGSIELRIPRHRDTPFHTLVIENYKRSEAALIATMAEMVVMGVSTAKVGRVMEELCGKHISKQSVSLACKELDEAIEAFCSKPIEQDYLFVMLDATYLKVRVDHRIKSRAFMVALGFKKDGTKELIAFDLAKEESIDSWNRFLRDLKGRGLKAPRMFTSDAHSALLAAIQTQFPDVAWQRCQAHFSRNICDVVPKRYRAGLRSELVEMFNATDIEQARERRDEIIADYASICPEAMQVLDEGFDDAMTVMEIPQNMRRPMRTTNYLERANREIKRRTKVIGIFPSEESALRLVGSYLIEENSRWEQMSKIYYSPDCEELDRARPRLIQIARDQKELRKAA